MIDAVFAWFTEPFVYPFMQQALMIAPVVAIVCATFSCGGR